MSQENTIEIIQKCCMDVFGDFLSEEGTFEFKGEDDWTSREYLWFADLYYSSNESLRIKAANELIQRPNLLEPKCPFTFFYSAFLIYKHKSKMTPETYAVLRNYIADDADYSTEKVWDFVAVNDNMPAMHMTALYLASKILDRPDLMAVSKRRLEFLHRMLTYTGNSSEFNSPTYTPLMLLSLSVLAEFADPEDDDIRTLALKCEDIMWRLVFDLFHKDFHVVPGPYSRAYLVDSTAGMHQYGFVLYQVLGDRLKYNPVNTLFAGNYDNGVNVIHRHLQFMQISCFTFSTMPYHCDPQIIEDALNCQYPKVVRSRAEISASAETYMDYSDPLTIFEFPAGVSELYTYIEDEYALGTCTKPFHNGAQTNAFHLLFKGDIQPGTMFSVMVQDGVKISRKQHVVNNWGEYGRSFASQDKNTAVVLYHAKPVFRDTVKALSVKLFIHRGEKFVEDVKLINNHVYLKLPQIYVAIAPACPHLKGVHLQYENEFFVIEIENEMEKEAPFTQRELMLHLNGFVIEVRKQSEYNNFSDFISDFAEFDIYDNRYENMHTRYANHREFSYKRGNRMFECDYSIVSEGIRYNRWININD